MNIFPIVQYYLLHDRLMLAASWVDIMNNIFLTLQDPRGNGNSFMRREFGNLIVRPKPTSSSQFEKMLKEWTTKNAIQGGRFFGKW